MAPLFYYYVTNYLYIDNNNGVIYINSLKKAAN